jgi:hypothetical protein
MRRAVLITFCGLGLVAPAGAMASAGAVPPVQGGAGVTVPGNPFNYIAVAAGANTLVESVSRDGGIVATTNLVRGAFGVPAVANDGSSTGLSADGRTLVLEGLSNIYPPKHTRLLVMDTAGGLQPRARLVLPGSFTVDAISATGRWLYLVHYRSPVNITDYEVRAYDLALHRLAANPVVDPRQPHEKMQGFPVTRTMSADGRWAYTLYGGFTGKPFIHALDTATRRAFCVDLPTLSGVDLSSAKLTLSHGTTLGVETAGTVQAVMDTRTFAVRSPNSALPPPHRPAATGGGQDNGLLCGLGVALLLALPALGLIARRRRQTLIASPPVANPR